MRDGLFRVLQESNGSIKIKRLVEPKSETSTEYDD